MNARAGVAFLSERTQFERVARRGKKITGFFWQMRFFPNKTQSARLGLVIGKRHVRKATRRNKIRRLLREAFRQHLRLQLPPLDIIAQISPQTKRPKLPPTADVEVQEEFFQMLRTLPRHI